MLRHMVMYLMSHKQLCKRKLGLYPESQWDFFLLPSFPCNGCGRATRALALGFKTIWIALKCPCYCVKADNMTGYRGKNRAVTSRMRCKVICEQDHEQGMEIRQTDRCGKTELELYNRVLMQYVSHYSTSHKPTHACQTRLSVRQVETCLRNVCVIKTLLMTVIRPTENNYFIIPSKPRQNKHALKHAME